MFLIYTKYLSLARSFEARTNKQMSQNNKESENIPRNHMYMWSKKQTKNKWDSLYGKLNVFHGIKLRTSISIKMVLLFHFSLSLC